MFNYSLVIQSLMALLWIGATQIPVPSNMSGLYTSQTEIIIGLDQTVGSSVVVDLKLDLTDTDQKLTGYLTVQVPNLILPLTLSAIGEYQAQTMHLKLLVGFCLESPSIKLDLTLADDGAIEFAQTTVVVTCNFSPIRLVLPRQVRLVSRSK